MASHLLIRHHAVGLQWSWMSAEQTCSRSVMFTEDSPIDVVKAVAGDQAVPAGCTGKTLGDKYNFCQIIIRKSYGYQHDDDMVRCFYIITLTLRW